MPAMMTAFTLILRKAEQRACGKSRNSRPGNEILTTLERASRQPTPSGINRLPLPSESPSADAGRQALAARLVALAEAHGMTLRARDDLSAVLAGLKFGEPIPIPAFAVLAEILFALLHANQPPSADEETS